MARIQFAAMVEEILGKLAGSIFQDSYLGLQIRGWTKPRNPQTQLSQLRRGDFRFLSSSWRYLTSSQRETWIDAAGTIPEAFRKFIGNNINLILIEETITNNYIPGIVPDGLPLAIRLVNNSRFLVQADTIITTVPDGCKLLLFATTDKFPTQIFTNPSQYEPIAVFDEGTSFSTAVNVISSWHAHYGQMRDNRRVCIKTAVIDMINGNRSEEFFSCSNTDDMIYQVYTAHCVDFGGGVITPTVLQNTLGVTVSISHITTGIYRVNAPGIFSSYSGTIAIFLTGTSTGVIFNYNLQDSDNIDVHIKDANNNYVDGINNMSIEIRKY